MELLDENARHEVAEQLKSLRIDVNLVYFDRKTKMSDNIRKLLQELASVSTKIKVEMHDFENEGELARRLNVDNAPVILIRGQNVRGDPRYYGIPSGYEFGAFLEVLKIAGGAAGINASASAYFERKDVPTKLEVFVTPTCPHCPISAYVALKLAIGSSKVQGYVYEAMEFPEIAAKYRVAGVPKTIINNGKGEYVGGYPEDVAVMQIKKLLGD